MSSLELVFQVCKARRGSDCRLNIFSEKTCDGIFHCIYGEDEQFQLCKDTFPAEATIKCIEKRLPGSIDITIMATPCDGIVECRDGSDENCGDDKLILVIAISLLLLTTICIYLYLVLIRLPSWKNSVLRNFDNSSNGFKKSHPSDCSELRGISLAKLKVLIIANAFQFLQNIANLANLSEIQLGLSCSRFEALLSPLFPPEISKVIQT